MAPRTPYLHDPANVQNMITDAFNDGFEAGQAAVIESMEGAAVRMTYEPGYVNPAYVPGGRVAPGSRARYANTFALCVGKMMNASGPWTGRPQTEIRAAFAEATRQCKGTR